MRTTIDIYPDVLAVRDLARHENKSLSELARKALARGSGVSQVDERPVSTQGFVPFAARDAVVDNDAIDCLREHEGL